MSQAFGGRDKQMASQLNIIYTTVGNQKDAKRLAAQMVASKLAICANIFSKVESVYMWEGQLCTEKELVIVFKVLKKNSKKLFQTILKNHPYKTPMVWQLALNKINKEYVNWALKI